MIRVVHILNELKYSGAEIMYVDAASLFQEKGCELSVVATGEQIGEFAQQFEKAGFVLFHKPYPSLKKYYKRILYFIDFIKFIKEEKFDIVHIHASRTMWGMAFCAWIAGKRSLYTFHNVFSAHFYSYPYYFLLRRSAKNIFNCNFQTISPSVYKHELKFFRNKTNCVFNWYGNRRFYPAAAGEKLAIRAILNIPASAFVLISVGGCSPVKRHSEIIKALPLISKKISECIYLHLGLGETEKSEMALAEKLNVSGNIRFYGNQRDVRKYLIASDLYIMPSLFEGISITTVEAMACLIPTILYDVPGLRDFNIKGENSVLIPEDYRILAEKVIHLNTEAGTAHAMALRAKKFVDSNFNMNTNVNLIYDMYKIK